MNGVNSLVVNKIFNKFEGVNFSFSSSFVMETYAAFTEISTASAVPPPIDYIYSPNRIFAWKYDAGYPSSSQYLWYGNITVDIEPGVGVKTVSGSNAFFYTIASGSGPGPIPREEEIYPASSSVLIPYQFQHYALVYSSASYGTTPARQLKLYQNGVLKNSFTVPNNQELLQDTAELLQVMGAVDNEVGGDAYSGSQVFFNDYRIYNGTDKGYTGSIITPPPSMVVWGGY